jgi:hypothetical protein
MDKKSKETVVVYFQILSLHVTGGYLRQATSIIHWDQPVQCGQETVGAAATVKFLTCIRGVIVSTLGWSTSLYLRGFTCVPPTNSGAISRFCNNLFITHLS